MEIATFKALSKFASDQPFKKVLNRICYQAGIGYGATNGHMLAIYKDDFLRYFEPRHQDSSLALPVGYRFKGMTLGESNKVGKGKGSYDLEDRVIDDNLHAEYDYPSLNQLIPAHGSHEHEISLTEHEINLVEMLAKADNVSTVNLFADYKTNELVLIPSLTADEEGDRLTPYQLRIKHDLPVGLNNTDGAVHVFSVDPVYLVDIWNLADCLPGETKITLQFTTTSGAIRWDAQLVAAQTAYGVIMPVKLRDPATFCEGVGIKGINRK